MLWQRKRDCMYLRVEVDNNSPHQQWCQCNLLLLRNLLTLINLIVVIIVIQNDNNNIIVAYEAAISMIMSLTVAATSSEMLWCMTTFQKSIILCFWQSVQLSEINTSLFWIRIAFMYDDQWDRTCCLKICLCTKRTSWSKRARMTMI